MNHSMLYLVMGQDNARGTILFEAPWTEPDGRIRVSWDQAGQQQIFTRMNEEIAPPRPRPARPTSSPTPPGACSSCGHLITAHPLGGCPMGDDYLQGAVDPFGRVFAGDGSVHQGLYVTDGSVIPSALGVNPLHHHFRADRTLRGAQDPATRRQCLSGTGHGRSAWHAHRRAGRRRLQRRTNWKRCSAAAPPWGSTLW